MVGVVWQLFLCKKEYAFLLHIPESVARSKGTGHSLGLGPRVHGVAMEHLTTK